MSVIESAKRVQHQIESGHPGAARVDDCLTLARFILTLSERLTPDVMDLCERWENSDGFVCSDELDCFDYVYDLAAEAVSIIAQLREGTHE